MDAEFVASVSADVDVDLEVLIPESGREGFFDKKRCHERLSLRIVIKNCCCLERLSA